MRENHSTCYCHKLSECFVRQEELNKGAQIHACLSESYPDSRLPRNTIEARLHSETTESSTRLRRRFPPLNMEISFFLLHSALFLQHESTKNETRVTYGIPCCFHPECGRAFGASEQEHQARQQQRNSALRTQDFPYHSSTSNRLQEI